jgi:hypothetical protein
MPVGKKSIFLLILLFLGFVFSVIAQDKITVKGVITDAGTGEPVLYANIVLTELTTGTTSNEKGEFLLRAIPTGTYTLLITYIGYIEYSVPITLTKDVELKIKLQQQSLGLKEVLVIAENSKSGTTSSKIKSDAISHVQASSLKDVMQLVPGNISENPNLKNPTKISIREIGTDVNSALGTAIIVDGIPLSNDGNMQNSIGNTVAMSSNAGTGVDLRSIAVENIESVTVDVGIPSAEHGNLTSGAVHIKTKAGGSPYNVKFQADPHTKLAYLGKGFLLGEDKGVVNFDFSYTHSYGDLVKQTDLYQRINTSAKYSKTFFRGKSPLMIDFKVDFLGTVDGQKWDPDMLAQEEAYSKERGFKTNLTADWALNKSWLTGLTFDFGFDKTWEKGFEKTLETSSSGPNFFSTATTDGEYQISYGPSSYYSEVTYDGRPYNLYSKLKANLFKRTGDLTQSFMFGAEWRTTGNNGQGRLFDLTRPPSGTGLRPRPFTDIPPLNQFSLFFEDKLTWKIGTTEMDVMAGLRYDNIQPSGLFSSNGNRGIDPRVNIQYKILNSKNNKLLDGLSLRLGYGQTTKAPTLNHLYPDKDYNDVISFNYYPDLIISTTDVVEDTRNHNLKPSFGNKYEAGLDFSVGKIQARVTLFYEKYTGGFISDNMMYPLWYRNYNTIVANLHPYYVVGQGVLYNNPGTGSPIADGYTNEVRLASWSMYRNADRRVKKGLEYSLDLGTIEPLRTSFNISGAWFYNESWSENAPYWEQVHYTTYIGNVSKQESFAVKFADRYGYKTFAERLNTNFSIINHIPELKMVISLNTQVIWFDNNGRKTDPDITQFYTLAELRDYIGNPDLFKNEGPNDFLYSLPVSYKFNDDIEHVYTISDFRENLHQLAIDKQHTYFFKETKLPVLIKCDLKLSKDIGKRFSLSFYANNFLNIRPWFLDTKLGQYIRRNQPPYFGADIKMQF